MMPGSLAALTMIAVLASTEPDPTIAFSAELEKIAPGAVADFKAAAAASEKGQWAQSVQNLGRVRTLAPNFAPAIRREAYARAQLGELEKAVELAAMSKELDGSFGSDLVLATVLMMRAGPGDLSRASKVIDSGLSKKPDDAQGHAMRCQILTKSKDELAVRRCFEEFATRFPADALAQFWGAIASAEKGDWSLARERLDSARALGLPEADYGRFKDKLDEYQPFYDRYWPLTLWVLGAWIAICLALILAGAVLSALTLAEAKKLPTHQTGHAVGGSAFLHRCYALVIFASVIFYYLSLPLVLLIVVGLGGGLIYASFAVGQVPIKLVVIVGIAMVVTVFAVLRSLFVRLKDVDPGQKLDPAEEPALRELLISVAAKIGTRPVDNVYLTPGAELAVMERGSLRKRMAGTSERCLVLGVAVLDGMTIGQLRSVLAHEYGHFTNRDTAGGSLGLTVRLSLINMAQSLAEGGVAAWYNPAWLFLNGFFHVFLRISQGSIRLQEVLADRWAAFAYGPESFAEGLTHAIRQSIRFEAHANATLKQVIESKTPVANLYAFAPSVAVVATDVEGQLAEVMNREPSAYDSHPRPADRIAWVRAFGISMPVDEAARAPAWGLFVSREALERKMTDEIRVNLAVNGLVLHSETAPA